MVEQKAQKPGQIDVDTRFLLANERTLLAWVRTSLALQGGGLALLEFARGSQHHRLAVLTVLLGALTAMIGYTRYRSADRAIRHGQLPRAGFGPGFEAGCVIVGAAAILIFYLR